MFATGIIQLPIWQFVVLLILVSASTLTIAISVLRRPVKEALKLQEYLKKLIKERIDSLSTEKEKNHKEKPTPKSCLAA